MASQLRMRMRNIAEWGEIAAVLVESWNSTNSMYWACHPVHPTAYSICQFPDKVRNIYILVYTSHVQR
jgi:hypothetical protein